MTTFAISASIPNAALRPRSALRRIPLFAWNIIFISLVAILGIAYLLEVNRIVVAGYSLRDAEHRAVELRSQVRADQIKLSETEAVGNLTAQAQTLGMVPVGHVDYVTKPDGGVALR